MIDFHPEILANLNKKRGQQPILLLELDWDDGATITYSDSEYAGARPYLVSADNITRRSDSQVSNAINVVLDATQEDVENSFRTFDMHLRPARLYLGFANTTQKALLFEGVINSQIAWDDRGRTLQFEILSKLEDSLVGFAMEDGFFPVISPEDRGKVWPLPFGTVCQYQAQRLTTTIKGFLIEGQGVVDPTLSNRICQIEKTKCPNVEKQGFIQTYVVPDANCLARKRTEGCILKALLAQQRGTAKSFLQVRNGENFPQNKKIKIRAGQVQYIGVMSGTTFTIQATIHPDEDKKLPCRNVKPLSYGYRYGIGSEEEANDCTNHGRSANIGNYDADCFTATSMGIGGNQVTICNQDPQGTTLQERLVGGAADSWKYYDQMEAGRYIFLPAGTEVVLTEYDDDLIYMASLVPGTVTQVLAYRQFGDLRVLTQVPTDWYTVENVDYGDYECVELRFSVLPSSVDEAGWSDDIYVSFVSSVGPNPVDIIEWLVEEYTDYSVDASNFASIKTKLAQFPSHFLMDSRPSVLRLIQDIAYQSRMAVRIVEGVVQLVYLAEEPTSLRTIDSSDIVLGSFQIQYTRTEDLATNHTITWRERYAPQIQGEDTEQDFAIRMNIPKYGSSETKEDWYTQTTFETLYKASTFWLIRKANTWQEIEFETSIRHLDLDVFDCVTLDIAPKFPAGTKIILTEKDYDAENNRIRWKAWTPIRAGETSPYYWAWPATKTTGVFPTASESLLVGDGSGKTVIPPIGHPLRVGYVEGEALPVSSGDPFPSDVGFVAPTVNCQLPLGSEFKFAQAPQIDSLARQVFNEDISNKQQNPVNVSVEEPGKEDAPCTFSGLNPCPPESAEVGDEGDPPEPLPDEENQGQCRYLVRLTYINPTLIGVGCGGPCSPERVDGLACNGDFFTIETVMSSYDAAATAATLHQQAATNLRCKANFGVVQPYPGAQVISFTGGQTFTNQAPDAGVCPEFPEGEDPFTNLYNPSLLNGTPPDGFDINSIDPLDPGPAEGLA